MITNHTTHYVPEGWEDLNIGPCAQGGEPVRWSAQLTAWVPTDTHRTIILTPTNLQSLLNLLDITEPSSLTRSIKSQLAVQEPL